MIMFIEILISCFILFLAIYWLNIFKFPLKDYILPTFLCCILSFIINLIYPPLNILSFWISGLIFLLYKRISIKLCLFSLSIVTVVNSISIYLIDFIIAFITRESFQVFSSNFPNRLLMYLLCSSLVFILISQINKLLNKHFNNLTNNKHYVYISNMILVACCLLIYWNMNLSKEIVFTSQYLKYVSFIIAFIICTLIAFIMILIAVTNTHQKKLKERELESIKLYTTSLEDLYLDMRKFRHDYINIISSLAGFLNEDKISELKTYFSENIIPLSTIFEKNNFRIGLLQNIKIPEIKGLLSVKLILAQEKNIDVFLDIAETISELNINKVDFTRILGILLDNAIEACEEVSTGEIKVSFIKRQSSVVIVIINTLGSNKPSLQQIYKKGFSTKGNDRGLGLFNVKEMMDKSSNSTLETEIGETTFTQILTIQN